MSPAGQRGSPRARARARPFNTNRRIDRRLRRHVPHADRVEFQAVYPGHRARRGSGARGTPPTGPAATVRRSSLSVVATFYNAEAKAGNPAATKAVAEQWNVSASTAAKWVGHARHELQLIQPAKR
jgi:hypothetical protein